MKQDTQTPPTAIQQLMIAATVAQKYGVYEAANGLFAIAVVNSSDPTLVIEREGGDIRDEVLGELYDQHDLGYYTVVRLIDEPYSLAIPLPLLNPAFILYLRDRYLSGHVAVVDTTTKPDEPRFTAVEIAETEIVKDLVSQVLDGFQYPVDRLTVAGLPISWRTFPAYSALPGLLKQPAMLGDAELPLKDNDFVVFAEVHAHADHVLLYKANGDWYHWYSLEELRELEYKL